jgi:hypothetical protein
LTELGVGELVDLPADAHLVVVALGVGWVVVGTDELADRQHQRLRHAGW